MDAVRMQLMLINTAASIPLQKIGQPQDMGQAIYYLLTAPFCTGVILDCDGGHGIRQYVNPANDPMRSRSSYIDGKCSVAQFQKRQSQRRRKHDEMRITNKVGRRFNLKRVAGIGINGCI